MPARHVCQLSEEHMSRAPDRLRIDSGGDQFTVSGPSPRLSWRVPREFAGQLAYEVEATVDGIPLPRVTRASTEHLFVPWPWASLQSCQRVTWRVRVRGGQEWSDWSDQDEFEAGLFDADWAARWIRPVEGTDQGYGNRPAYSLSASFELSAEVESARLYATALGVYEAFLNGRRAGTAELTPGSTSYDRTLYAQAMDVTDSLGQGTNELVILLSDGWYRGKTGGFRQPSGWGTATAARLELHIWHRDGSRSVVRSDEKWTSTMSTITRADLMDGQSTDFGLSPAAPRAVVVDQVVAPGIDWSPAPPVRRIESRAPVALGQVEAGTWVADFGQNASGWISLADLGPAGAHTVIDFGEFVGPDGDLTTTHLDMFLPDLPSVFVQRDEVVSAGDGAVFEPRHTIHGFQYARIRRDGAVIDPADVTMHVVQTDLRRTGTFECSNADLNQLYDAAVWSFRGNAVDVPTDCPTRERLGWTGDFQVFAPTAARLYDVHGFGRKWLRSVRDDQLSDGRIANFSPDGRRTKLMGPEERLAKSTGSAGWGDAVVAVPMELYETYGDREVLAENWDAMVRWVEWARDAAKMHRHPSRIERSAVPLPHEQFIWDGTYHWGEWCEPGSSEGWQDSDKGEVGTAYLYRSSATLARIAEILGRSSEAARYARLADQVLDAWRTEFLDVSGRTTGDTQAGYVRALAFGLVPEALREAAVERLVELIRVAGNHLGTGFLSTGELLPVLADNGYPGIAYELLFQRTPPSWLAMQDRGATTIWENWDGIDEDGIAHDSLNHYSKGAVVHFLHTHVLGLRQADGSIGWESFVVSPIPHPEIRWARGTFESPQGTIEISWQQADGELRIEVDVPPGSTADVIFRDGETVPLSPGRSGMIRSVRDRKAVR
ncbi:family 78 glycoside hydrolase catalytic domain [Kribbella sp. NPDC050124]|uniref:family 78 glycoside hydrolase catalytic domain n=1 Tax=Kribbella sp. NPDC050124 TaxID=3364114 RepID=UPI00379F4494